MIRIFFEQNPFVYYIDSDNGKLTRVNKNVILLISQKLIRFRKSVPNLCLTACFALA